MVIFFLSAEGVDKVEHPIRSIRVQTDGRFIEEDELRFLDQNLGDPQSLPHPFRIGPDFLLGLLQKANHVEATHRSSSQKPYPGCGSTEQ